MVGTETIIATLVKEVCCYEGCGVMFGIESGMRKELLESHAGFYCPNGHVQCFFGETEAETLRKQLAAMTQSRDYHSRRMDEITLSNRSLRGVVTRTKNRIGHGVCPCCNRTFRQLANHIKSKHPEYIREER